MKAINYISLFLLLVSIQMYGQQDQTVLKGVVTYATAKDIYVRFGNTSPIQIGDTLFNVGIPCLIVNQKSSSSCICISINDCKVAKEQEIIYIPREKPSHFKNNPESNLATEETLPGQKENAVSENVKVRNRENIKARISASSYSNLSTQENEDIHRTMLRFNMNAYHIKNSNYSFETYINFRENFLEREVPDDYKTRFFNVYNLALTYHLDSTSTISLGRKVNRRISSVGPIDGLQVERKFGSFHTGGIIGFKPDLTEFGFNHDLLEYGAFIGISHNSQKVFTESTLGILEQQNAGVTDRRYAYLQHSSTINRKLNLFSSIELDLYEKINEATSVNPRLTNLFVSTRYRFNRKLSLSISYDARKRIIYYETLRTEVERLLADDEARQGIRLRLNTNPLKYIHAGISYGKRFQSGGQNKSNNINLYISHSRIPLIRGRVSVNLNENKSNYMQSRIFAIRYSRTVIKRKLEGNFYFRNVNYKYINSEQESNQKYYGANLSLRLSKTLRFSFLCELANRDVGQSNLRLNTKLIKRINKKQRR